MCMIYTPLSYGYCWDWNLIGQFIVNIKLYLINDITLQEIPSSQFYIQCLKTYLVDDITLQDNSVFTGLYLML